MLSILFLGFLLRIYRFNYQSLWYDEAFSVSVGQLSINAITHQLIEDFVHPPLHYYILHGWFNLFGFGDLQARLLSVFFGFLAIIAIYLLARYLFEPRTARLSALLMATSQLTIMYSQEVRPYAQLMFLVLITSYLFIVSFREKRLGLWCAFILTATLTLYTHYYGLFVLLALLLYAFIYKKRYNFPMSWIVGGIAAIIVSFAPWLISGIFEQALNQSKTLPSAQGEWFSVHWYTFISTLNKFNNGKPDGLFGPSPWWAYLAGGFLFFGPLSLSMKPLIDKATPDIIQKTYKENIIFLSFLWIPSIVILISLGMVLNFQYDTRYVVFCAAPYYILVSRGITGIHSNTFRSMIIAAILVYTTFTLHSNYFVPYKENYRDALAYLASSYQDDDCTIFLPFGHAPRQWGIYHGNDPKLRVTDINSVSLNPGSCERIWIIEYRRVNSTIEKNRIEKQKIITTHSLKAEKKYFWIHVSLYVPTRESGVEWSDTPLEAGI